MSLRLRCDVHGIFAPSVVIFGKRFVDVGFGYAFLAFAAIPSYASKLPCHLLYGGIRGIFAPRCVTAKNPALSVALNYAALYSPHS